jgi:hypothetical protein
MWMQFISSLFAAVCLLLASSMLGSVPPVLLLAAASFSAWYSHDEYISSAQRNAATWLALLLGVLAFLWLVVAYIQLNF